MDKETFKRHQQFAKEKKPSMLRRCVGHDYTERRMYMLTMVTEGRKPYFGYVAGQSEVPTGSDDEPRMVLSELGQRVSDEWWGIPRYYPQIDIIALQMMPDHLHGVLFVREKMKYDLSRVVRGFKTGCNHAYRELVAGVPYVATESQHTREIQQPRPKEDRTHGLLFARGFNDRILLRQGQLERWLQYLKDNPRRLLMKREHPDLFRIQRGLMVGAQSFSAIGNRFLLERPERLQVQCSRSSTDEQIHAKTEEFLKLARQGAVLVSPSISKGEKHIMRAAFEEGLPLIILQENGFSDLAKPGGQRMEACARGQLLLLAPWEHHNERLTIRRDQCLSLNALAKMLCQ